MKTRSEVAGSCQSVPLAGSRHSGLGGLVLPHHCHVSVAGWKLKKKKIIGGGGQRKSIFPII